MATSGTTVTLNPNCIMLSIPYTHCLQFLSTLMKNCYFKIPDNQGPYNIIFLSSKAPCWVPNWNLTIGPSDLAPQLGPPIGPPVWQLVSFL